MIRKPAVAGMFYPDTEGELKELIGYMLNNSRTTEKPQINGLIVPHAGYVFSGSCAAKAYKHLDKKYNKIVILGPAHTVYTDSAYCDENEYWQTPLGEVKTSCIEGINKDGKAHEREHSLEVQLPFLQYMQGNDFTLIPIVVGDISKEYAKFLAKNIEKSMDENTLLIVSTDLSHFYNRDVANKLDNNSVESIKNLKEKDIDACGINPLRVFFEIAKSKNYKPQLIDYSTSADFSGDDSAVVGYASFIF